MSRSSEEGYAVFRWIAKLVTRRYKAFVLLWVLVLFLAIAANQVWRSGDVVSFSQSATLPEDTESAQAGRIIEDQFPGQLANSTITIVVVANDTTVEYYRWFVSDLHAAIVDSSRLVAGEDLTMPLRVGGNITLDRPIEFLQDPSNATVYGVYESFAFGLAEQFNGPVHMQVSFTQSAAGIYWGLPAYFVGAWSQVGGSFANETAYGFTQSYISSLPAQVAPWANASFEMFYPLWRASFSNPAFVGLQPMDRAEAVVQQALPAFLSSPFANASFTAELRYFQLGMLSSFRFSNFTESALIESYALSVFAQVPVARLPFFEDLYHDLPEDATEAQTRAFAREESLAYDLDSTPLVPPFNVSQFYLSGDRKILLMNYAFGKEPRYIDAQRREPIVEDVLTIRDLVVRMKAAYAARADVYVTGSAPSSLDQEETIGGGAEFIATIILVIVLIGLYFRSLVSPVFPILTIAIALMIANLFVWLVATYLFAIDFTVTAVLQTVLLAVGTDYSIFLVSRYRDERRDGRNREEAVRNSVIWAGESIATSGGAVLISFVALSLGSFPLVKTLGLTIGFAVTVALGISLTFIPAVLLLLGNRVFWPSGKKVAAPRPHGQLSASERYFRGAASFSMRHAKAVVIAAVLITVPATYLVLTDLPAYDFSAGIPPTDSSRGLDAISGAFGYGFIFPTYVVVRFANSLFLPDGNVSIPRMDALHNLSTHIISSDEGVKSIEGPTNPQGSDIDYHNMSAMPEAGRELLLTTMAPYIGKDNRTVRLLLVLSDPPFSREALATIERLSAELAEFRAAEPHLASSQLYVGGVSAVLNDVRENLNRDLQIMAIVVIIGLFVVLLFVLGSVLIPVRAILTILLSISWTFALTIVLFHAWKGLDVVFVLPLALFVMAMGLGMDYDIFIITRVREEVAKGKPDADAISEALTRTGGIISACGIVMAGAFFTLMLSPLPFLEQIGFALAFAILLDSTVVRIYLVPAIMVLAGKYNWWAPGRLQRVRRADKDLPRKVPASDVDVLDEIDDI